MSYKRPTFYRHIGFKGNAAARMDDGFLGDYPSCEPHSDQESTQPSLHWGAHLRPHHFEFSDGSRVLLRIAGRRELLCQAISVLGSGRFLESESSHPVEFDNGAIIVKAGERFKLFSFDEFKERFVLENGAPIETIYQIDYQTPKK
jgi:hypothetical protein